MNIQLISIGHPLSKDENVWIQTYIQRISHFAKIEHRHVKDKLEFYQNQQDPKYCQWIKSLIPKQTFLIALDQHGKKHSTESLHEFIFDLEQVHKHITFIIGGSYGLPSAFIKDAHHSISLGPMTLPHKLALLVLTEQVYRCFTIQKKIPYHHVS